MLSCQNKSRKQQQFWHFLISKKAQLPAIRILLSNLYCKQRVSLIVAVMRFPSIFAKNGQSNLILVLILESNGP